MPAKPIHTPPCPPGETPVPEAGTSPPPPKTALTAGDKALIVSAALEAVEQERALKTRRAVFDKTDDTLRMPGGPDFRSKAAQLHTVSERQNGSPLSPRSPVTVNGRRPAPGSSSGH